MTGQVHSHEDIQKALSPYRVQINDLDEQLIQLLAKRQVICKEVGALKRTLNVAIMQPARVAEVIRRSSDRGTELGLDANYLKLIYSLIIAENCRIEMLG